MMSSRVRERHREKKRSSKINLITALCSVSLRHDLISSENGSVMFPALLSVITLRMLIRASSAIRLNPADQHEYLRTDNQSAAD